MSAADEKAERVRQARIGQIGLFRRKAEKVRSKGMAVSVEGGMMRAVLEELDWRGSELERFSDAEDRLLVSEHEAILAAARAECHAELDALRAERDRAIVERDTAKEMAADAVRSAVSGNGQPPAKTRNPRTKEEPWKSICVAADRILRDEMDMWGQPLADALAGWGEKSGENVGPWIKALSVAIPTDTL